MAQNRNTWPRQPSRPPLRAGLPSQPPKQDGPPIKRRWFRRHVGDRRRGRDLLLKILTALGYINTVIIIAAAVLLTKAKPDAFHSMYKGLPLRNWWHPHVLQYLFALCVFGFFLSLVGLFINSQRLKRKSDSVRINLVVLGLLSIAGIIAYLTRSQRTPDLFILIMIVTAPVDLPGFCLFVVCI